MRVLLLFWGGGQGGDASVAIALAKALKDHDEAFVLAAYAHDVPDMFRARAEAAGLRHGQDFFMVFDPADAWNEIGLPRTAFDLIHVHHGRTVPKRTDIVPLRKLAKGLPIVLTAHGPMPLSEITYGGIKSKISRWLSPLWFSAIIVPSAAKAREWRQMTPFGAKVIAVPNLFRFLQNLDKDDSRNQLSLPPDVEIALFCSRLDPDKDPECFVRAVKKASEKRPRLIGLMAGIGELEDKCDSLIRELGAPVRRVGYAKDPSLYYSAADVFVQPSLYESFGITLLHAAEMGLPCVASNIEVFRDLYSSFPAFRWFEPHCVSDCAEGIIAQLESKPNTAAQKGLRDRFDAEKILEAHLQLYQRVQGEK